MQTKSNDITGFQLRFKDKDEVKTTKKLRYQFTVYKVMVIYSNLRMLHFSVNILRPACVDREQNNVLAVIYIEEGVRRIRFSRRNVTFII